MFLHSLTAGRFYLNILTGFKWYLKHPVLFSSPVARRWASSWQKMKTSKIRLQRYRHRKPWGCHMHLSWESPAIELPHEADRHHQEGLLSYTEWPADPDYRGINSVLYSEYGHWSDQDSSLTPAFHHTVFQPTNGNTGEGWQLAWSNVCVLFSWGKQDRQTSFSYDILAFVDKNEQTLP